MYPVILRFQHGSDSLARGAEMSIDWETWQKNKDNPHFLAEVMHLLEWGASTSRTYLYMEPPNLPDFSEFFEIKG